VNAFATGPTVHDFAKRVQAARVFARIHAAVFVTDRMQRAVLGPGAVAFRLTASRVWIAHVTRRALAHRIVRGTGDAECRRMTGIWTACLHGNALDIGHRVRPEPGRALTDGLVIVCDADRVYTARVFIADIIAGMREPVAELRWWAIDVVHTRYCSTSGRRVVRVARVQPGRTLAVGHVIVDDTEGIRAAGDEVADQLAGERTVRGTATRLVLRTLAVGGAAIFARTVAAATIVRIAGVTRQAVATTLMILGHAA